MLGSMPCASCQKRLTSLPTAQSQIEFTSESIKTQRKIHRRDILPMHNRGELDRAWVNRYGEKKAKQHGFTDKEIKNARYVWSGSDEYYHNE